MKIPSKTTFQPMALNYSPHVEFKEFVKINKDCSGEPHSLLVNGTALPLDNPLRFRNNLL